MSQKEAVIEALKKLGGRAHLSDIYKFAYPLADWSGSQKWENTLRWYLQKGTETFRSPKRGWWELVSYQEEIASRDKRIKELEEENAQLKAVKTEDDFVRRLVSVTKNLFSVSRKHADYVRQVLLKLGRDEDQEELLAWIERREQKPIKKVTKKIFQKISNSQVFNGSIMDSEFNGGGQYNE